MIEHGSYRFQVNILAKDLAESTRFYRRVAGLALVEAENWYALLAASGQDDFALCLIDQVSEFVPRGARGTPAGTYFTLVVDDVRAAVEAARELQLEIVEEAEATADGTRAVLRDPNELIIEIVTPSARLAVPPREAVG
ncbi:MAG TPA: VOC family protein [Arsenicitalea sp.]|nr:VOC family protein [Arsenicitalea sp.]